MWAQKLIHTIGNVLGVGLSAFIGYRAVLSTVQKFELLEKSSSAATAFITWPFAAVIAIGFLLMAVAFLFIGMAGNTPFLSYLMRRADSLEKTLMLGKIEGKRMVAEDEMVR